MENASINSFEKFMNLNFNLRKIIFSFLNLNAQRKIYWLNKKLRPLLPDSPFKINITFLKKTYTYNFEGNLWGFLETEESSLICFTTQAIKLVKFGRENIDITTNLPLNSGYHYLSPVMQENGNIIVATGHDLLIADKNFSLIQFFVQTYWIIILAKLSENSFAIGNEDGTIKIYKLNSSTQKYEEKEYNYHSQVVVSILYLPKQNYLLSSSWDKTIKVLDLYKEKQITILFDHDCTVSSLISLNDKTFASSSKGVIKIWSIEKKIKCIKTIITDVKNNTSLKNLGEDLMVSIADYEFKIWDLKNYECIKTYTEDSDSSIYDLMITKNHKFIITRTNNEVNVWQILV